MLIPNVGSRTFHLTAATTSCVFADQREKERDQRLQEMKSQATVSRAGHNTETTTTQSTQSADGSARSTVTKTERLIQSSKRRALQARLLPGLTTTSSLSAILCACPGWDPQHFQH